MFDEGSKLRSERGMLTLLHADFETHSLRFRKATHVAFSPPTARAFETLAHSTICQYETQSLSLLLSKEPDTSNGSFELHSWLTALGPPLPLANQKVASLAKVTPRLRHNLFMMDKLIRYRVGVISSDKDTRCTFSKCSSHDSSGFCFLSARLSEPILDSPRGTTRGHELTIPEEGHRTRTTH